MGRKGESITLSLKDYEKQALEELAREYGLMWGDRPNISKLLKAIAKRELLIAPNHNWSKNKLDILNRVRKILVDIGKVDEAKLIAQILCDRSEINDPLRREIENFLDHEVPAWRQKIDNLIKRQQSFKLVYKDASEHLFQFTVLYARVEFREKRYYLLCRCEETEGNQDVEELKHNWTLRLDRIVEAEVTKIDRKWKNDLQQIPLEFHLFDKLIFNYERKPEDIEVGEIEGEPPFKKVIRNVDNTFWIFREIVQYWENCVIISPETVRQKFITEKLQLINRKYNLKQ